MKHNTASSNLLTNTYSSTLEAPNDVTMPIDPNHREIKELIQALRDGVVNIDMELEEVLVKLRWLNARYISDPEYFYNLELFWETMTEQIRQG